MMTEEMFVNVLEAKIKRYRESSSGWRTEMGLEVAEDKITDKLYERWGEVTEKEIEEMIEDIVEATEIIHDKGYDVYENLEYQVSSKACKKYGIGY